MSVVLLLGAQGATGPQPRTGQSVPQPRTGMPCAFAIGNENKGDKIRSEILFSSMPLTLAYKIDTYTSTALDRGGIRDGEVRIAAGVSPDVLRPGSCPQHLRKKGTAARGQLPPRSPGSQRGGPGPCRPAAGHVHCPSPRSAPRGARPCPRPVPGPAAGSAAAPRPALTDPGCPQGSRGGPWGAATRS